MAVGVLKSLGFLDLRICIILFCRFKNGWLSKLWSRFGYPKYQVPYYIRDPKRDLDFDNHPNEDLYSLKYKGFSFGSLNFSGPFG